MNPEKGPKIATNPESAIDCPCGLIIRRQSGIYYPVASMLDMGSQVDYDNC